MSAHLTLDDARRAWQARDPAVVELTRMLAEQPDEPLKTPLREGAYTYQRFLRDIQTRDFRKKTPAEQWAFRTDALKRLEAADAEAPLPERWKLHEAILPLWEDNGPLARRCLLEIIASVRLTHGPWRALKRVFKEAEARDDWEVFGALAARFDAALGGGDFTVSRGTLGYLCRRAWRKLRRLARRLPACYADAAVEVLANYPPYVQWLGTWVGNHIFYHETKKYGWRKFNFRSPPGATLRYRAFADFWRRSPRPLLALLERASNETVFEFATSALKTDFRASLREVEPSWVARLPNVGSGTVDDFVVWILKNLPRFEQNAFRELGLHAAVLKLLDSPSGDARVYAADYARAHARDLPVADLPRLANNNHEAVRKLAIDLLLSRDPRREVGLEIWGRLLETEHGHDVAADNLRKHFGASELTPDWFRGRLLSGNLHGINFAGKHLLAIHPRERLGAEYFVDALDALDETLGDSLAAVPFLLGELPKFEVNALPAEFLQRLLVRPTCQRASVGWLHEGRLKPASVGTAFFKTLAYHVDWDASPWVAELRASGRPWAKDLAFSEALSEQVLAWLRDVRRFTPADLGFEWLMKLVGRGEPRYHDFAVETMIKAFLPADFAPAAGAPAEALSSGAQAAKAEAPAPATIDLGGASFLFTGKLATMTRDEAQEKVRLAGGAVSSAVSAKLDYLVIGDEGSPLYGHGKKGSKQLKAEELQQAGAPLKIISETAFLQMLAGEKREATSDAVQAGCERLWAMMTDPRRLESPEADFARKYLRRHHPDICLAETDRPVDPGAEIPPEFLTFERVRPLFSFGHKPVRDFALELAKYEFARWAPPMPALVALCETAHVDARRFVESALLADDAPEHRRYRVDPARLTPEAVYGFCESRDESTRALGMRLIEKHPRLRLPEELFRLTESPDRRVRAFVIRAIWSLYRERGVKENWKPNAPPQPTLGKDAAKKAEEALKKRGDGMPARPEKLPAPQSELAMFLRRVLFELPPGRFGKSREDGPPRLKPLPARKAKLALVEVLRDLAVAEREFAEVVTPLLREFQATQGPSEHAACLVALTRIRHAHGA